MNKTQEFEEIITKLSDLKTQYNLEKRKIAEKYGYFYFQEIFNELIEAVPEIERVYWTQYTPYWNDGETCIFSVNDICYDWSDEENDLEDEADFDGGFLTYVDWDIKKLEEEYESALVEYNKKVKEFESTCRPGAPYNFAEYKLEKLDKSRRLVEIYTVKGLKKRQKAIEKFIDLIKQIPDDFMQEIFGDGVLVEITKDGVTVEEHGHD